MQSVYNCFSQLLAGTAFVLPLLGFNLSSPALANSQTYPQKYVRIIVPFPPGGPNDFLARTIGRRLSEVWGQAVIIENKPGAATQIGAEYVAKAAPDGYTLMVTSNATSVLNPVSASIHWSIGRDWSRPSSPKGEALGSMARPSSISGQDGPCRRIRSGVAPDQSTPQNDVRI
jgi:hypothetical protein